jgi:hypothetical protein
MIIRCYQRILVFLLKNKLFYDYYILFKNNNFLINYNMIIIYLFLFNIINFYNILKTFYSFY